MEILYRDGLAAVLSFIYRTLRFTGEGMLAFTVEGKGRLHTTWEDAVRKRTVTSTSPFPELPLLAETPRCHLQVQSREDMERLERRGVSVDVIWSSTPEGQPETPSVGEAYLADRTVARGRKFFLLERSPRHAPRTRFPRADSAVGFVHRESSAVRTDAAECGSPPRLCARDPYCRR